MIERFLDHARNDKRGVGMTKKRIEMTKKKPQRASQRAEVVEENKKTRKMKQEI